MKLWRKTQLFPEGKYLVIRRDGSVPEWPYLVLGARDPAAPEALRAYAGACEGLGMDPEYVQSVREVAAEFVAYREEFGEGKPDGAPDLTDSPEVLEIMRGGSGTIYVHQRARVVLDVWFDDSHREYVVATSAADAAILAAAFIPGADPEDYFDGAGKSCFQKLSRDTRLIVMCDPYGVPVALSERTSGQAVTKTCAGWVQKRGRGVLERGHR